MAGPPTSCALHGAGRLHVVCAKAARELMPQRRHQIASTRKVQDPRRISIHPLSLSVEGARPGDSKRVARQAVEPTRRLSVWAESYKGSPRFLVKGCRGVHKS